MAEVSKDLDEFEQATHDAARSLLESTAGPVEVPAIGEFLFPKTERESPPAWWPFQSATDELTPRDVLNGMLQTTVKVLARNGYVTAEIGPDGWWVVRSVEKR